MITMPVKQPQYLTVVDTSTQDTAGIAGIADSRHSKHTDSTDTDTDTQTQTHRLLPSLIQHKRCIARWIVLRLLDLLLNIQQSTDQLHNNNNTVFSCKSLIIL